MRGMLAVAATTVALRRAGSAACRSAACTACSAQGLVGSGPAFLRRLKGSLHGLVPGGLVDSAKCHGRASDADMPHQRALKHELKPQLLNGTSPGLRLLR